MLGQELGGSTGKRTGRRVLSVDGGFTVEVSFEANGTMLGVQCKEIGTYTSTSRPDGTLFGEGQGVLITPEGEVVTWKGSGVGVLSGGGSANYRGAVYYSTASAKLASLNKIAGVFEFEGDADGNTRSRIWEWK